MGSYISSAVSYYSPTQLPTATSATTGDDDSVDAFLEPPTAKRPRLDNDNDGGGTTASLSTMPDKDVHGATADKTAKPIDDVPLEGWIENWISYASYGWFVSDTVNFYDCTLKRTIVPGLLEMGGECSTIVVNLQRGYAQFIHADAQQAGHLRRTTIPFTMRIDAPIQINKDNNAAVDSKDQDVSGATEPSSAFSAVHQAAAFARAKGHVWIGDIAQWASNEMDTTSPQRIVFRECQLTCTWIPSVLEESKCVDRIALCSPPQCLPILSYIHVTWSKKEPSLASSSYEPVNDIVDSDHHHSRIQIWWRWFPDQYSSYLDEVASFSADVSAEQEDLVAEHEDVDKAVMENTQPQEKEDAGDGAIAVDNIEIAVEDDSLINTNHVLHALDALASAASLDELPPTTDESPSKRHKERKSSRRAKRKRDRNV